MIDKLDLNFPSNYAPTPDLERLTRIAQPIDVKYYYRARDLRPHYPAIVFLKSHRTSDNKLSILNVSSLTPQEICNISSSLFVGNALDTRILRLDLAADVPGFSVGWFKRHAFVSRKTTYGEFHNSRHLSSRSTDTIVFGKRPNLISFYNKVEERLAEFTKGHRRLNRHEKALRFEEYCGLKLTDVLTRVERRYGGNRLPKGIKVLGNLFISATTLDPFAPVRLVSNDLGPGLKYGSKKFVTAAWLLGEREEHSIPEIKKMIYADDPKNGARTWKQFDRLLSNQEQFSAPDLRAIYVDSVSKQLGVETDIDSIDYLKAA